MANGREWKEKDKDEDERKGDGLLEDEEKVES